MGPVSGTGRAMMASLQQAVQKGMPPDQAVQYVKSMATQGVAPLADLYSMMNQFQRLQQQQVKPPQTPPTIKDQLNMATQQQQMQQQGGRGGSLGYGGPTSYNPEMRDPMDRGLGAIDAGRMEYPQFAGGGIVAFQEGGQPDSRLNQLKETVGGFFGDVFRGFGGAAPGAEPFQTNEMYALSADPTLTDARLIATYREAVAKGDPKATQLAMLLKNRNLTNEVERANRELAPKKASTLTQRAGELGATLGVKDRPPAPPTDGTTRTGTGGGRRIGTNVPTATTTAAMPTLPDTPDEGLSPFIKMIKEAQKTEGIGGASEKARKMLEEEAAEEKRLTPEQKRLAGAQAAFAMAEAYSRRGRERVSGLGGLAEAGKSYTSSLQKINNELRDASRSRRREAIALDRADELQAAGNVQAAVNMRESARADTFRRTELAVRQLESKLDRDLRMRLGMAQIGAQNLQTYATIKQKAIADYSDYVSNLSTDPRFTKLDEAQQNEFLKQAYERIVNSAVSDLGGGGGGSFSGFSIVNRPK